MRLFLGFLVGVFILSVVALTALFVLPRPNFEMAEPRDFPWPLRQVRAEMYSASIRKDGKLEISLRHEPLPGVTPAMLAWWYQQLPLGTHTIANKTYSYYHLFHPSEHGVIEVLEVGEGPGISKGALVTRRERFGAYYSKGKARVISIDTHGMVVSPEVAGLHFGLIEHRFSAGVEGTIYTVHAILGSDSPVFGPLINLYIRKRLFPDPVVKEWVRHQTEEVGSLPFFLPDLFQEVNK